MARPRRSSVFGRFLETVERDRLLPDGCRVLVAVSGGADSVCLLDLLLAAAPRMHLELRGFHMNHRLRPAARQDEKFVRGLFERKDVELVVVRSDVGGYAKRHRVGLEEAGRVLRYRHMERIARRLRCDRVALGHTADDSLETILLNLARGTGPAGLAGIPVRRGQFVRPMLDLERTDVVRHLQARGLDWVEDESNLDPRFRRNLVRARVMAALREVNPGAGANARRAARLLGEENAFLDALTDEAREAVVSRRCGRTVIDPVRLSCYNVVLQRRLVIKLMPGLDSDGIGRVLRFCSGRSPRLVLNRGLQLQRYRGLVEIVRVDTEGSHA
jgi:tRNA(Ile)-lysidine synthase